MQRICRVSDVVNNMRYPRGDIEQGGLGSGREHAFADEPRILWNLASTLPAHGLNVCFGCDEKSLWILVT